MVLGADDGAGGSNEGITVLLGGLIKVCDDVCSWSPYGTANGTLVLLARRFWAGDAGQVGTAVVPVAGRSATEDAVAGDWGRATAPAAEMNSSVVKVHFRPLMGAAHASHARHRLCASSATRHSHLWHFPRLLKLK